MTFVRAIFIIIAFILPGSVDAFRRETYTFCNLEHLAKIDAYIQKNKERILEAIKILVCMIMELDAMLNG